MSKFNAFFGVTYKEIYAEEFFGDPTKPFNTAIGGWNDINGFIRVVNQFIATNGGTLKIPYPMARGYSDIFCVEKSRLFEFARLCGIFAAMNMFCEIAIPTAAVLTFERNEVAFFPPNSRKVFWGNEILAFEEKYNRDFDRFYKDWDSSVAYVHPVKLSKWAIKM